MGFLEGLGGAISGLAGGLTKGFNSVTNEMGSLFTGAGVGNSVDSMVQDSSKNALDLGYGDLLNTNYSTLVPSKYTSSYFGDAVGGLSNGATSNYNNLGSALTGTVFDKAYKEPTNLFGDLGGVLGKGLNWAGSDKGKNTMDLLGKGFKAYGDYKTGKRADEYWDLMKADRNRAIARQDVADTEFNQAFANSTYGS